MNEIQLTPAEIAPVEIDPSLLARVGPVRYHDATVAAEYMESNPFSCRDIETLQKRLARADALLRLCKAKLTDEQRTTSCVDDTPRSH